jgi:murein DD-endopeptidase MepM/ murein hydrolase activator NlpD
MIKLSLNLPLKKRLYIHIVERRKGCIAPNRINLEDILRVRKGSKVSRLFRQVFEKFNIKKILGTNIALAITISTLIPNQAITATAKEDENPIIVVAEAPISLPKEQTIRYPVEQIIITQKFSFFHPGIDLDGITGDPIYPIAKGKVEAVDFSKYAYGNAIYIVHENGLTSLYAHLSKILVKKDQEVTTGDKIGEMGATGHAFGDHLHLEIRKNGLPINPLTILPQ